MNKQKVLVIGYFGHITNQVDGQTIRTNSIYNLLKENSEKEILFFDTELFKVNKLTIFKLIFLIFKTDIIFDVAAHGHLKYLFPIIYFLSLFSKSKFNFVAIGGWLYDFLKNKPLHRFLLSKVDNIFVQTNNLHENLKEYDFKNTVLLNNFRMVHFGKVDVTQKPIKNIVFMARVHKMKGVELIFQLSDQLKKNGYHDINIDIYGPIYEEYKNIFLDKLPNSLVNYGGVVQPNNVYSILEKYDFMIFPTKYYTEGFPGSILDAYISGLPVVVSAWLNAHEFVDDNLTGYIVEFDNENAFINKVIWLLQNPHELVILKQNILEKRKQYSSSLAWNTLLESKSV